jgi:hypothetical protein
MEDGAYLLAFLSMQDRLDRIRHVRPPLYTREATRVERVQHVADRLWRTASGPLDLCGLTSLSTRQQDLPAVHREGIRTAHLRFECGALIVCDRAKIER